MNEQTNTVAFYIRTSTKNNDGVKEQFEELAQMALQDADGLAVNARIYVDAGYSALDLKRPEYLRLKEDIKTLDLHTIYVTDMDRLTRDPIELAVWEELQNINPNLI